MKRTRKQIPDFSQYLTEWADHLEALRQNSLLNESDFIHFARDRDIPVQGIITGTPGDFHRRNWLRSDGRDYQNALLFHPFRIYPLGAALQACRFTIEPLTSLDPSLWKKYPNKLVQLYPPSER